MLGVIKWRVTGELNNFQREMAHKEAPLHSKLSQNSYRVATWYVWRGFNLAVRRIK